MADITLPTQTILSDLPEQTIAGKRPFDSAFSKLVLIFSNPTSSLSSMSEESILQDDNVIVNWEEYNFDSDFLTPCAGWSLKVGDEYITPALRNKLKGGTRVQLAISINDITDSSGQVIEQNDYASQISVGDYIPISTGTIDQITYSNNRDGTFIHIHGRDILGQVVDGGADPFTNIYKFQEDSTIADIVSRVFYRFNIHTIYTTDNINREIISGNDPKHTITTLTTTTIEVIPDEIIIDPNLTTEQKLAAAQQSNITVAQKYDPTAPLDLETIKTKKVKPVTGETCFQFVERVLKRFHLHCWPMIDGTGVVIGTPDYDQTPIFSLIRRKDGQNNNIIDGRVNIDYVNQPSLIIAKGFTGGGDIEFTRIKAAIINEFIGYSPVPQIIGGKETFVPLDSVKKELDRFTGFVTTNVTSSEDVIPNVLPQLNVTTLPSLIPATQNPFGFGMGPGGTDLLPPASEELASVPHFTRPASEVTVKTTKVPITLVQAHDYMIENYSIYFDPPNVPRTLYLEDTESKTVDQLIGSLRRKMSEYQRHAIKLEYTVEDHQQNGNVWRFNTLCTVEDEVANINGTFWIERVSFTKSRHGGTLTKLELIPLYTIFFGNRGGSKGSKAK